MNPSPAPTSLDASADPYRFTAPELARLAVYRAAVRAGFYTDHDLAIDPTAPASAPGESPPLGDDHGTLRAAGFTPTQIARLVAYRDAVAAGLYREAGAEAGGA